MSSQDPTLRFIGVHSDRGPLALLGLSPDACSGPIVDAALVSRLARIYDHPDGRSRMGEEAREMLREAARLLKDDGYRARIPQEHPGTDTTRPLTTPGPSSVSPAEAAEVMVLDPLQRQLMQILASSGGWNAMARARLASVGAMHGVSESHLIEQLRELAARPVQSGLPPLQRVHSHHDASRRAMEPGFVERVVVQYAPELRSGDRRSLLKLCILFGSIGALLVLLMYRLLFFSGSTTAGSTGMASEASDRVVATVIESGPRSPGGQGAAPLNAFSPAQFLPLTPLPGIVLDDVDASPGVMRSLEMLARRAVGMEALDPAFVEAWDAAARVSSSSWFAADDSTARALRRSVVDVIEVAGANPRLVGPLLGAIAPGAPKLVADPLAIPRGAWRYGMASVIAARSAVSPSGRLLASEFMRNALDVDVNHEDFEDAVGNWLAGCVPSMTEALVVRTDSQSAWRLWYLSVDSVRDPGIRNRTLLVALGAVLRTDTDLSRPGLPQMVLGRLLVGLDWSDHASLQRDVLGWFDDPDIGPTDVWVLASILASLPETSWFERSFVPPPDADMPMRRRMKDRAFAAWPRPDRRTELANMGVPEGFDPQLAGTWLELLQRTRAIDRTRGSVPMLKRVLMERLLAESANALVLHGGEGTLASLNDLEVVIEQLGDPGVGVPAMRPGGGIQGRSDGQWARLYSLRGRTRDDKIDMFRELENQSGDDLGPIDADVLVREALSASLAVRQAAQYLIETRFSFGPNVAQAMVDRIPEARKSADVSNLVESVTGTELPRSNSARWPIEVRLALVNHALSLRLTSAGEIDSIAAAIAQSIRRESTRMGRLSEPGGSPEQAARALVAAWEDRIAVEAGDHDDGWRDAWRDRRSARSVLAGDALQRYLVEQISLHELLAHWINRIQPIDSSELDQARDELSLRRDRAVDVLEQMLLVESAIVDLWQMRIRHLLYILDEQGFGGGA